MAVMHYVFERVNNIMENGKQVHCTAYRCKPSAKIPLTPYHTANLKTSPSSKHLQTTKYMQIKTEIHFGMCRQHCGKRRKCWLPAFSPFPILFLQSLKVRIV